MSLITKYKQALATLVELDENEEEELKEDQEEADSFWPKLQDLPKLVLYAHAENDFEYQERVFLDKKLGPWAARPALNIPVMLRALGSPPRKPRCLDFCE